MTIKEILNEINLENGSNYKIDILNKYKDNDILEKVLYLANSKRVKYYIKQIPEYTSNGIPSLTLKEALLVLNDLSSRAVTGTGAKDLLKFILVKLPADDAYIIERIIDKDLKIGLATTSINKVFPKLIEKTPYMGAKAYRKELIEKLFISRKSAIIQTKMDGRYSNAIIRCGEVETESRAGEPNFYPDAKFINELKTFPDCVLNGELTISGENRYISNGMISSMTSIGSKMKNNEDVTKELAKFISRYNKTYKEGLDSIVYTIWDSIKVEEYFNMKSDVPYYKRLDYVRESVSILNCNQVKDIESKIVTNYNEAMEYFQSMLKRGEEGAIIKAIDGQWINGKKDHQVKMKLEIEVDLEIIRFNYGTPGTKNEHVISSIMAQSSDGIVITNPAGMKENEMEYVTTNQDELLGTIIAVKCCGLSKDSSGKYSLLHPVYVGSRVGEKDVADSFDDIQNIEDMVKGLK